MKIKCNKCGHEWEYKGIGKKGQFVTCPMCQLKTKIEEEE